MNMFIVKINTDEITNLNQLKTSFRKKIKELHPDITGKDSQDFLVTYQDYIEARSFLDLNKAQTLNRIAKKGNYKKNDMLELFVDLMASNFPLDKKIASQNKIYQQRISKMNLIVNSLIIDKNLFSRFENDLLLLRGESTIMNHDFNVIISYLNNIRDYIILKNRRGKNYIQNTYELVIKIALSNKLKYFITYINWLVVDIIGKDNIRGNLPTTAST